MLYFIFSFHVSLSFASYWSLLWKSIFSISYDSPFVFHYYFYFIFNFGFPSNHSFNFHFIFPFSFSSILWFLISFCSFFEIYFCLPLLSDIFIFDQFSFIFHPFFWLVFFHICLSFISSVGYRSFWSYLLTFFFLSFIFPTIFSFFFLFTHSFSIPVFHLTFLSFIFPTRFCSLFSLIHFPSFKPITSIHFTLPRCLCRLLLCVYFSQYPTHKMFLLFIILFLFFISHFFLPYDPLFCLHVSIQMVDDTSLAQCISEYNCVYLQLWLPRESSFSPLNCR